MPTTPKTRIRRVAEGKVTVHITARTRSSAGFDVSWPEFGPLHFFEQKTKNVPTKAEALSLLLVKAKLTSELVFKIVPRKQRAAKWCDACHSYHVKPLTEAEHNELQCFKQWKEPKP